MIPTPKSPPATDDVLALDPALREKAQRWFADAREQTRRDDEEIEAWHRRRGRSGDGDCGSGGSFGGDGGDCGGGD